MQHFLTISIPIPNNDTELVGKQLIDVEFIQAAVEIQGKIYYYGGKVLPNTVSQATNRISCSVEVQFNWPVPPYSILQANTNIRFAWQPLKWNECVVHNRWEEPSRKQDWKTEQPVETQRQKLLYSRILNQKEYYWLTLGRTPLSMDDKWFAYLEQNRLYYHRSWTGQCVFEVEIQQNELEYVISTAWGFHRMALPYDEKTVLQSLVDNSCREAIETLDI